MITCVVLRVCLMSNVSAEHCLVIFIPPVECLITLIYERLCECKVCELPLFILYIVSAKALT